MPDAAAHGSDLKHVVFFLQTWSWNLFRTCLLFLCCVCVCYLLLWMCGYLNTCWKIAQSLCVVAETKEWCVVLAVLNLTWNLNRPFAHKAISVCTFVLESFIIFCCSHLQTEEVKFFLCVFVEKIVIEGLMFFRSRSSNAALICDAP